MNRVNMNQAELIRQLSATIDKAKVIDLSKRLREEKFALSKLVDLTFDKNKQLAFRAAWLLENVFLQDPHAYLSDLNYLLKRFTEVSYPSCKRHYAKIMMNITDPKAPHAIQAKVEKADLEQIIEHLFEWMIDPEVKIAVKVFSGEALFNLRHQYTWIADELTEQIHYLMRNGTAAIQSRGRILLQQLGK